MRRPDKAGLEFAIVAFIVYAHSLFHGARADRSGGLKELLTNSMGISPKRLSEEPIASTTSRFEVASPSSASASFYACPSVCCRPP